jgi:septal ring factor EnvC (AmiA/AmiB activator)
MDRVDEIVNEKHKEIERLQKEIKLKELDRSDLKKEVDNKINEKKSLENQITELEKKKQEKANKLEAIKATISGDRNANIDFEIKPEEVFKYIPATPLEGIREIENSLEELRDILNYESEKKTVIKKKL